MILYFSFFIFTFFGEVLLISEGHDTLDGEVENLYSTEDGETSKQAHCPSNDRYLSFQSVLCVFLDEGKSRCVKIDVNHFQLRNFECLSWIRFC